MISSNLFGGSRNELGPYRATRLWNDLVRTFRAGMPVGRKRRQLKVYEDAFVASDAVTWLHEYLQQNLDSGPEITRPQTVLLLQKFQRSGVIQDVRGEKSNAEPLEDNGHLFRFTRLSPRKLGTTRVPLTSRTNLSMPSAEYQSLCDKRTLCSSVATLDSEAADPSQRSGAALAAAQMQSSLAGARRWQSEDTVCTRACSGLLSSQPLQQQQPASSRSAPPCSAQPAEKGTSQVQQEALPGVGDFGSRQSDDAWKAATLEHLRKALLLRSCDELPLDVNHIKETDIVQNVTQQLRNSGSRSDSQDNSTSPTNDSLPGWLAIAMRCLARWPKSRASCGKRGGSSSGSSNGCDDMPRYPGFERDVYTMVKDYFESQPEPVIPFRFYRVLAFAWARTLVAGAGCGREGAATVATEVTSSTVTPRCEPPPLPPRRRLVSKSPGAMFVGVATAEHCMSGARERVLSVDATPGPMFAKLEQGPVLRAPQQQRPQPPPPPPPPPPVHDVLNGSLYYTPPNELQAGGSRSGSEHPMHSSAPPTFLGRSPLDFYQRRCDSRVDLLAQVSKTDGALAHTSKRSRTLPLGGSLPNLAFVDHEREKLHVGLGGSGTAAAAAGAGDQCRTTATRAITGIHFGSGESIYSDTVPCCDANCAVDTVAVGKAAAASSTTAPTIPSLSSRRMSPNSSMQNFASVHDLVTAVESDQLPAQHRWFSAADINHANAFPQSCFLPSSEVAAKGPLARTVTSEDCAVSAIECRSVMSYGLNMIRHQQPHSNGWSHQQQRLKQQQLLQQQQQLLQQQQQHRLDPETTRVDWAADHMTRKPAMPDGYKPVLSAAAIGASRRGRESSTRPTVAALVVGERTSAAAATVVTTVPAADDRRTFGTTSSRSPPIAFRLGQAVASSRCSAACSASPVQCTERPSLDALSEMMHNRLLRALQLCLLLLPPTNRRHLQILLRLLHGLSNSSGLLVDVADKAFCMDTVPTTAVGCPSSPSARDAIIGSFWRSILRSHVECDVDELATMRIVSFFIDHHEQVMNVPADLTKSIECSPNSVHKNELPSVTNRPRSMLLQPAFGPVVRAISLQQLPLQESQKQLQQQFLSGAEPLLQVGKIRPVSYCQQVTKEEYEEQRMSVSERALTELLENILADTKMTEKDKKKKLKQFQKAYPEIFLARFPTLESQPSCMKEQPKIKQPLLARPLRLLRSLR